MQSSAKRFILWGGTGQAKVLADIILLHEQGKIEAVFDMNPAIPSPFAEVPIHYGLEGYRNWLAKCTEPGSICAMAAIGGGRGRDRHGYFTRFRGDGFMTPTLIHPTATVLHEAVIGKNCQIMAHVVIGANAVIGDACLINTKAGVDHECIVSDGVHIAPGATLCGNVRVGAYSFIAAGAVILPNITIGANSIVGAGAVVTKDIPDNVIAFGNPARVVKENE